MGGNRYVIFYQNGERGPACRRAVSDLWLDELRGHPDPALRPAFRVRVRMKSLAVRMADVFNAGPAYRGPGAWRKAFEAQQRAPGPEVTDMAVSVEAFRGFVRL